MDVVVWPGRTLRKITPRGSPDTYEAGFWPLRASLFVAQGVRLSLCWRATQQEVDTARISRRGGGQQPPWPAPRPGGKSRGLSKGSRSCFLAKWFLEAWCTKQQNRTVSRNNFVFGLAAEGGKSKQTNLFPKMSGCLALVPQASKKPLGQKITSASF